MIEVQAFDRLGRFKNDWLNARYHFSFSQYHDPKRMGVGGLRVWNDDEVAPGTGFDPHPHKEMEIITYVRQGAITHRDNLGNEGRTEAGDVQAMSAGTGIRHQERNEGEVPLRLFQIWLRPRENGGLPNWGTRPFPKSDRAGQWAVLASGRPDDEGALPIRADARVLGATLKAGQSLSHSWWISRHAYLVPTLGAVSVNGERVEAGDGIAITEESMLIVEAIDDTEVVLVEVF